MELESLQIIYVIWNLWQNPKEIVQSTDISTLNVCKLNNIFDLRTWYNDKKTMEGLQSILLLPFKKSWGHVQVSKRLKD